MIKEKSMDMSTRK